MSFKSIYILFHFRKGPTGGSLRMERVKVILSEYLVHSQSFNWINTNNFLILWFYKVQVIENKYLLEMYYISNVNLAHKTIVYSVFFRAY